MICEVCGTTNHIVHSGTDALVLDAMDSIGKICYDCANARAHRKHRTDLEVVLETALHNLERERENLTVLSDNLAGLKLLIDGLEAQLTTERNTNNN